MNSKIVIASSLAVAAAAKEKAPVVPEANPFDMFKPLLLEPQADTPFFWVALFGYCLAVALAVSANSNPKNFYQGWLLTCLTGYGGGTLVPMLCGKPGVLVGSAVHLSQNNRWIVFVRREDLRGLRPLRLKALTVPAPTRGETHRDEGMLLQSAREAVSVHI